jgi:glycosyltransferase involved in cell wall biosynthesis
LPPVKNESLAELFNTQEYYMQLSMAEGFPNALCEAMLCGCTPIVSAVFSMPEIVGDVGYILTHRDTLQLDCLMEKVLKSGPMDPSTVRSQISERYSIQVRAEKLRKLILSLGC